MGRVHWDNPRGSGPRRRTSAQVENLALVPASLLPHKATYQRLANQLPAGAVLVVLPRADGPETAALREAARRLRTKGHAVTTLFADELPGGPRQHRAPVVPAAMAPLPAPSPPATNPREAAGVPSTAAPSSPPPPFLPAFAHELRLVHIDASAAPARFLLLRWQPLLWGGVALVQTTGRLGRPGRVRTLGELDAPLLPDAVAGDLRERLHHGYQVVDWH